MAGGTMPKARSTTIPATITTATVALGPQGTACRRMTSGESTTSTVRSCDKESRAAQLPWSSSASPATSSVCSRGRSLPIRWTARMTRSYARFIPG